MADQIIQVIEVLSEKLGVAAEYLYPLLIRQSYIIGFKSMFWCIIAIVSVVAYIKLIRHYFIPDKDGNTNYNLGCQNHTQWVPETITVLGSLIVLVMVLVFFASFDEAINALSNPEWYAIKGLLEQIS